MTSSDPVLFVREAQKRAMMLGALPIWTVYNRPSDHPGGYIARLHLAGKGLMQATDDTIFNADLADIRRVFRLAGLSLMARSADDAPQIVESWL